jgi:hypothetical protein
MQISQTMVLNLKELEAFSKNQGKFGDQYLIWDLVTSLNGQIFDC